MNQRILAFFACVLLSALPLAAQTPLGTAFSYQGRLTDGGGPANGSYDFRFTLFDAASGGSPVGPPVTVGGVAVGQGLFTVTLDFGASAFQGQARWLGIEVQLSGGGGYTTLSPRQPLTPAPGSVFSSYTDPLNLTSLNASNLTSGTVPGARLSGTYSLALSLTNPANAIAGVFSGNGAALTSLNASSLASGTVPSGVVSGTYGNAVTLSNPANAFTGDGSGLTNLNAQPKYVRSVVVSPVGAPVANGAALLAALAGITTASGSNPWLLKIEPGIYDVATTTLLMKPFVDVEGSGELATTITGQGSASNTVGTVQAVTNSELRFLTVENTGGAAFAKALFVDAASPRISHVTARGFGASVESQGFFAQNGAGPTVTDLTASASATGSAKSFGVINVGSASVYFNLNAHADGGTFSVAVGNYVGATPTLRNVVAIASGATTENQGVASLDSSPTLENVVAVATGAAVNNLGCLNNGSGAAPTLRIVVCRGLGASGVNYGNLNNGGAQPTISDLTASAFGGTYAHAVENNGAGPGLSISRARVSASGGSIDSSGVYTNGSSPRIVDLEAYANATGGATAYGIQSLSASPTLLHVTSIAAGQTGLVVGVWNGSGSSTVMDHVVTTASGGGTANGVLNNGGAGSAPSLTAVTASSFGASTFSTAIFNGPGTDVTLTDVTAQGAAAGGTITGIFNDSAVVRLRNVVATGSGGAGSRYGLYNGNGASTVSVDRSTLTGVTASLVNTLSSTTRVAVSQLVGPVSTLSGATTTCFVSYNGSYLGLNGVCQ